jgi:hypothetical protein
LRRIIAVLLPMAVRADHVARTGGVENTKGFTHDKPTKNQRTATY